MTRHHQTPGLKQLTVYRPDCYWEDRRRSDARIELLQHQLRAARLGSLPPHLCHNLGSAHAIGLAAYLDGLHRVEKQDL
jgi:hypothetical protein